MKATAYPVNQRRLTVPMGVGSVCNSRGKWLGINATGKAADGDINQNAAEAGGEDLPAFDAAADDVVQGTRSIYVCLKRICFIGESRPRGRKSQSNFSSFWQHTRYRGKSKEEAEGIATDRDGRVVKGERQSSLVRNRAS